MHRYIHVYVCTQSKIKRPLVLLNYLFSTKSCFKRLPIVHRCLTSCPLLQKTIPSSLLVSSVSSTDRRPCGGVFPFISCLAGLLTLLPRQLSFFPSFSSQQFFSSPGRVRLCKPVTRRALESVALPVTQRLIPASCLFVEISLLVGYGGGEGCQILYFWFAAEWRDSETHVTGQTLSVLAVGG